jgi:hypothetical protein
MEKMETCCPGNEFIEVLFRKGMMIPVSVTIITFMYPT